MDSLPPVIPKAVSPSPQSSVIVSSPNIEDSVIGVSPKKEKLRLATLFLLVVVFMFVSVMTGILFWILSHEFSKSKTKTHGYKYTNYELGCLAYS